MAMNVIGQQLGGDKLVCDNVETVGAVRRKLNIPADYAAAVNGDSASDNTAVDDNDFVTFSRKVKGGQV
jgi:sulfur carrier protein ThiS